jgi:glycosyltransferase involved in cell wall biosynthesis
MRTAIIHNYLDNIGGAERVALTLARELEADIITTSVDEDKIRRMGFGKVNVKSIGQVPANAPLRQEKTMRMFRDLDLKDEYDFHIIDGDWAITAAIHNKPNMWYVHAPIRELWDMYEYTRDERVPWYGRWAFQLWAEHHRRLNLRNLRHVEGIACNSRNTQEKVKRYLHRDSTVIYPPIDTSQFKAGADGGYWLSVNRLISHKRVDLQMEAFSKMPHERLIIVGSYEKSRQFREYAQLMKRMRPKNVELRSWVRFDELVALYAECRGFITTAKDEDFGMTAVEAMASGKPVIAPNEGGYRESVQPGRTGELIDDINAEKLAEAIRRVGQNPGAYREDCLKRAKEFDTGVFMGKIRDLMPTG